MLRLLAEIAVAHCLASELPLGGPRPGALNFIAVDSFVRLLCTLIRCAQRAPSDAQSNHSALGRTETGLLAGWC